MQDMFEGYVLGFAQLRASGAALTASMAQAPRLPAPAADAPLCLVFSPHPDDEAIAGALPWRLRHAHGWRVLNIAVTLGSNAARRPARWQELQRCCDVLGFGLASASGETAQGLGRVTLQARDAEPAHWSHAVDRVASLLRAHRPALVVCPHGDDGHPAHIGTHHLVLEALTHLRPERDTWLAFSEYWNTQSAPRLMVELGVQDVAVLMGALAQHEGEVARNPYHLGLPAWFMDGVRRGAERVGAPGAAAPPFAFAALYGMARWRQGSLETVAPRCWARGDAVSALLA